MTKNHPFSISLADKVLEVAGLATFIAIIALPAVFYADLPEEIPTHFNFKGQPDAWGSKSSVWLLPAVAAVLYIGLSVLNYFLWVKPPGQASGKNDLQVFGQVFQLLQTLKFLLNLSFVYIISATIRVALRMAEGLGVWFLPVFITVMTVIPLFYLVKIAGKTTSSNKR